MKRRQGEARHAAATRTRGVVCSIAIVYATRKHLIDFPISCESRDARGRTAYSPATTAPALIAPVHCKMTIFVATCPVVAAPIAVSIVAAHENSALVRSATLAVSAAARFSVALQAGRQHAARLYDLHVGGGLQQRFKQFSFQYVVFRSRMFLFGV